MKKKRLMIILGTMLTCSLMLAGCNKKDSDNQSSTGDVNATVSEVPTAAPTKGPTPTPEVFPEEPTEIVDVEYYRVSVHDPSIVKADGTYYIFGSHRAWAESKDLMDWETFNTNVSTQYSDLLGGIWEEWSKTESNPNLQGNMWAPDVIYNKDMDKYCMYMSVNGDDWKSTIVLLTADDIKGPYEYVGPVVYSGFNNNSHPVEKTDVYKVLGEGADISRYQSTKNTKINAIDPCVKYDDEGSLWMSFGSWFGGLYMFKLDKQTGLRDYTTCFLLLLLASHDSYIIT